jgi:hypothetical protein
MNFNDYIIGESDFEFYESLPEDERILFLYDLICDDAYGQGSMEPPQLLTEVEVKELVNDFTNKIGSIISASIKDDAKVNVIFINNTIIFNSNNLADLKEAVLDMILDGYILSKFKMTPQAEEVFHKQDYCFMYTIIGQTDEICLN